MNLQQYIAAQQHKPTLASFSFYTCGVAQCITAHEFNIYWLQHDLEPCVNEIQIARNLSCVEWMRRDFPCLVVHLQCMYVQVGGARAMQEVGQLYNLGL